MYTLSTIWFFILSLVIAIRVPVLGQSSVLQTGSWYKVAVENRGVYKITFNDFKKMGFSSGIDPRKIKVFGNAGGMLPQASNISRAVDLTETAIYVAGEADGSFDRGDYLLFFAEGPDHVEYDTDRQVFAYENNLYSDKNFYYITISNDDGKRIVDRPQPDGNFPVVDQYDDYVYHEVDQRNVLSSGREWVGERFDVNGDRNFTFDVSDIVENSLVKIVSDVMGQSYGASSFDVSWNDALIINQAIPQIPNTQYGVKGIHRRDTVIVNASDVGASSTSSQTITYQFNRASSGASTAYLDFFLLNVKRKLRLSGHKTIFRSLESTSQTFSTFAVAGATAECSLWNISQPHMPQRYDYLLEDNVAFFSDASDVLQEYIIFDSEVPAPEFVGTVHNQDLRGLATPNLIIITHSNFLTEALRLAEHRRHHNQWNAVVVTPEQIYNEFSSGRQDVSAIRDFIKHLYNKNPQALQSVLLIGKGSYDYKDRIEDNTNYVPTYESRNSVSPLATYSSDDFFGFLEDHEGHWGESPVQHHTLDIGVGRLPVKSAGEAKNIVDKIIYYDTHKRGYGRWRKEIAFVGDDGNNTDNFTSSHQSQANSMAEAIELSNPGFDAKKIFLGTYVKTVKPNGETIPEASKDVISRFDRGSLIINFTGHGNEKQWTDEKIFSDVEIEELDNKLYPFLVTATCEFGRHDDPAVVSSAELTLIKKEGGSIGLVTTARPVNAGTNFVLNQEFYQSIFEKKSSAFPTLGEVFRNTKNNSASGVGNRNFSLLADPSMTLAIPSDSVIVTGLHTLSGSDTLKALSTVVMKGEIHDESGRVNDFNGILALTLFDKEVDYVTIGKNNPAFHFNEWSNALYRGKATIENGMFEVQFILTKNISSEIGAGKLSLYAHDSETYRDAGGALLSFKIGGTESEVAPDNTPPELHLFMDDTTFVSGGIVSTNSTLIVNLFDESGINISEYDTGKALVAYLDQDDQPFILNDYYEAYTDDFRTGSVHFPVKGLTPGKHSIKVKAWDTHNNEGQASIDFMVTDSEDLVIETLGNYPNPFQFETSIFFTHNRSGDDLLAQLEIFNSAGMQLKTYEYEIFASSYRVDLGQINDLYDFGKKLPGGLYLARLVVRSLTNGSKNERVTKLIVVN